MSGGRTPETCTGINGGKVDSWCTYIAMAMTASVSNTAYQKRRLRGKGVNGGVSRKDQHHLLSRRLHDRKTAIFTSVKANRRSPGSERREKHTGKRHTISAYALRSLIDCLAYICSPEVRRSVLVTVQALLVPRVWARSRP
jgi:hypothetical protein